MVFRIAIVLFVIVQLAPHEPNLGLPRAQTDVSQLLATTRANIASRASLAIKDMRQYDHSVRSVER